MASKVPEAVLRSVLKLSEAGLSGPEIAKRVGIHRGTVWRLLKKHRLHQHVDSIPVEVEAGGPPDEPDVGATVVDDSLHLDGSLTIRSNGRKPPSPDEIAERCNIDTSMWVQEWYKGNVWEGFYKLKNWLPDSLIEKLVGVVKDGGGLAEAKEALQVEDAGHRVVQLTQGRVIFKRIVGECLEEAVKNFARSVVKPLPKKEMTSCVEVDPRGYWLNYGHYDFHIGGYAHKDEVGENYDVNIARNQMFNAIEDMSEELRLYKWKGCVMPMGNDWYHIDSVRMTTTQGDHFLDTDTRFGNMFLAGLQCAVYQIESVKRSLKCPINVLYVPGNHDHTSSFLLCCCLAQRYLNDPTVQVDLSMNPRKYRKLDGNLLGFSHGKDCRPEQWGRIIQEECSDIWSDTTYREINIGHTHQKRIQTLGNHTPGNGVCAVTHPALTNTDSYHHFRGFTSPVKAVHARRYDNVAFRGCHDVYIRPDPNDRIGDVVVGHKGSVKFEENFGEDEGWKGGNTSA